MNVVNAQGHQFSFDSPLFLLYRDPAGKEARFPYDDQLRLKAGTFSGEIRIKSGHQSASLSPLSREQLGAFLPELFRRWGQAHPDGARKAAFDYVDAQRGFVGLALVVSLIFTLPVGVALLADSHQQFSCTKELEANAVPGEIQVVKATKKDSRSYKIRMEFTAPNGQVIKAQDLVHTKNEKDIPKSLPILYSPERPICWSLMKDLDSKEVNWAKRRYFSWFTLLFGMFFIGVTLLGLSWSVLRRTRPRPFTEEVRNAAALPAL
jgi:hypothetical protein